MHVSDRAMDTPPHSQTTIFLRPVGSALPLGFFAFGIGMLILGCQAIGWIPVGEQNQDAMILIAFVFPLELVATVFAFLARDTLGATTLGLFATSWLAFGWLQFAAARMFMAGLYKVGAAGSSLYEISGEFASRGRARRPAAALRTG
jgi:succinate-acetate transporter protein